MFGKYIFVKEDARFFYHKFSPRCGINRTLRGKRCGIACSVSSTDERTGITLSENGRMAFRVCEMVCESGIHEGRRERHYNEKRHNYENARADALQHVSKSHVYPRASKGIGAFSKKMPSSSMLQHCNNIHAIRKILENLTCVNKND